MDRADMTHPLTPHEKVEPSLNDLLRQAVETMKSWTPEQREAHFEAQKKAWVAAEMAFGDEGTRVVTALASGSGDHSGGVTDIIGSGDRAELARLADMSACVIARHGRAPSLDDLPSDPENWSGFAHAKILAEHRVALLAENAALRAESENARTVVAWANNSLFGSCG
ncbi:hypothetical protein HMPREF0185_00181, partial [Brevundimonas diminuta 470-4]